MIVIDKKSLQGKRLNQRDGNYEKTGVWLYADGELETYKNGELNGWRFYSYAGLHNLELRKIHSVVISVLVEDKTNKITRKEIAI